MSLENDILTAAQAVANGFAKFDLNAVSKFKVDITFDTAEHAALGQHLLYQIIARSDPDILNGAIVFYQEHLEAKAKYALGALELAAGKSKAEHAAGFQIYQEYAESLLKSTPTVIKILKAKAVRESWSEVADTWFFFERCIASLSIFPKWAITALNASKDQESKIPLHAYFIETGPVVRNDLKIRIDLNWIVASFVTGLCINISEENLKSSEIKFDTFTDSLFPNPEFDLCSLYNHLLNRCGVLHFEAQPGPDQLIPPPDLQHNVKSILESQRRFLEKCPWPYEIICEIGPMQSGYIQNERTLRTFGDYKTVQAIRAGREENSIDQTILKEVLDKFFKQQLETWNLQQEKLTTTAIRSIESAVKKADELQQPKKTVSDNEAYTVFALIKKLNDEDNNTRKAPILGVMHFYCIEGLTMKEVAKRYKCARSLIVKRLGAVQKITGRSLKELRQMSSQFEKLEDDLRDGRAKSIDPEAAIYGTDPEDID